MTGWVLLSPEAALLWCGFVLLPFLLTAFLPLVARVVPRRSGITTGSHFRAFRQDLRVALLQFGLHVALLAHQAWLMCDAIVRTLSRLYRREQLLQWVTAAAAGSDRELTLGGFYRRMAGAVVLATCAAAIACFCRSRDLVVRGAIARRMDAVTSDSMVGQPGATPRPELAVGCGIGKPAPHCAAYLAFL